MSSFNRLRANTTTEKSNLWHSEVDVFMFFGFKKGSKDPKDVFKDPVYESLSEPRDYRMRVSRLSKPL